MQNAKCKVQNAKCKMQNAKCKVQYQRPIYLDRKNEREQKPRNKNQRKPASALHTHHTFCTLHFAFTPQSSTQVNFRSRQIIDAKTRQFSTPNQEF
jgi:hypothetical protein